MPELESYCPTCDKVLTGFNDMEPAKDGEHHGVHRECGYLVQLRRKK